jgi:DNA-binding NtrC family response regulator
MRILIVEDEKSLRIALADELRDAGYEVVDAPSGEEALPKIKAAFFDLVVTDLVMDRMSGLELLKAGKEASPGTEFILITAHATVQTAVDALKAGAIDYLTKPFAVNDLMHVITNVRETIRLKRENIELRARLGERSGFHRIIGQSDAMQKVFEILDVVAGNDATVLVCGETGTGKQLAAEAIHYCGSRRDRPFITVSCASLSRDVLESELFGHEKGAFTGAVKEKRGRFELAHTGTLFLDDVDDIPLETQVKLLQVLEAGKFERVGGESTLSVDVRLIASSKLDLETMVREGRFRKDLFYRLNVIQVRLPPLRERIGDIPLLADHFLKLYSPARALALSPEIMERLLDHRWEGNVRELKHVIERLVILARDGAISDDHLPGDLKKIPPGAGLRFEPGSRPLPDFLFDVERDALIQALTRCNGSKSKAAELLGIPLPTLKSKCEKFKVE